MLIDFSGIRMFVLIIKSVEIVNIEPETEFQINFRTFCLNFAQLK